MHIPNSAKIVKQAVWKLLFLMPINKNPHHLSAAGISTVCNKKPQLEAFRQFVFTLFSRFHIKTHFDVIYTAPDVFYIAFDVFYIAPTVFYTAVEVIYITVDVSCKEGDTIYLVVDRITIAVQLIYIKGEVKSKGIVFPNSERTQKPPGFPDREAISMVIRWF